jgi:hypothetical protein
MAEEGSIRIVCEQAGVDDVAVARETLDRCGGDVVLAISMILFPDKVSAPTPPEFDTLSDVDKLRCVMQEKELMYHAMVSQPGCSRTDGQEYINYSIQQSVVNDSKEGEEA